MPPKKQPRPWERTTYIAPGRTSETDDSGGKVRESTVTLTVDEAKDKYIGLIARGIAAEDAIAKLGRVPETYRQWRLRDPEFARRIDRLEYKLGHPELKGQVGDFGEWRRKYLKTETYWHQWQWVDLLEAREPRELHERQNYAPG